jgi:hypothetical protein
MKSGPAELQPYRAEEIDPGTNAPWKKGKYASNPTAGRIGSSGATHSSINCEDWERSGSNVQIGLDTESAIDSFGSAIRRNSKAMPASSMGASKPEEGIHRSTERTEEMTHTPAPPWEQLGISEEEWNKRQREVKQLTHSASAQPSIAADLSAIRTETKDFPPLAIPDATDEYLAQAAARHPELAPPEPPKRKPRSDKGVQRGPKAPGEPEAAATTETTALTVELTAVQYADLEREAARVYRDIEPRYLTESPATVLLNSRVQKHWRTLVGK